MRQFVAGAVAAAITLVGLVGAGFASPAAATGAAPPDLAAAVHYLTTAPGIAGGTTLARDGYYESFADFADFGLTIDGAFALAATGTDNATLQKVVGVFEQGHTDASGQSANDWTGIGTAYASGGSIGKEALLAEVTGFDPHAFGGHDLLGALDQLICVSTDVTNGCAAPGNYVYATSTFSQALGIIAQLRAGDTTNAAPAIAYLESLQNGAGAWPSLLPSNGVSDVDSTAMAAMALALIPHDPIASAAVTKAQAWIASKQGADGGFAGTAGNSTNSAALAIQALTLARSTYSVQISKAVAFLGSQQNHDGGFNASAGDQQGSDVRASTQVVSGIVGTSLGVLADDIATQPVPTTTTVVEQTSTTRPPAASSATSTTSTSTTATSIVKAASGAVTPDSVPTTLPATGAGTDRSLAFAALVLALGCVAIGAGRRRRGRR